MEVFISYRRADSEGHAGRLYDSLKKRKMRPFMDVDNISSGENFRDVITRSLTKAEAFICVMGPRWSTIEDDSGAARLYQPDDPVRLEVEWALKKGIPIIPALVWNATMPKRSAIPASISEITDIDALVITHRQWDNDVDKLHKDIHQRVKASRGRGVSKLGGRWAPLEGRTIFTRWLNEENPPALVGRNGGVNGKLLKQDVDEGRWKQQRYEVWFGSPPRKAPQNWLLIEDFINAIAPNATKEPPVITRAPEGVSGEEIVRLFLNKEKPPTLMGRLGGLRGKPLTGDIETGAWRERKYDVSYSEVPPPRNWFTVESFVTILQTRYPQALQADN